MPGGIPTRFYGPAQLGATPATLYTVPADKRVLIQQIHVSNPSESTVDLTLSVGTDAAGTRVWDDYPIPARGVYRQRDDLMLTSGESIQAYASSAATLVATISGLEAALVDYYVELTGNDSTGNGSVAAPWRTVEKACDTVTSGTIRIGTGTFVETATCTLADGVSLVGAGSESTIIQASSDAVSPLLSLADTTTTQVISDLRLDGQSRTTSDYGLWADNVTGLTITRIDGRGFKGPDNHTGGALNVTGATDLEISYSTFSDSGGCFASFGTSVIAVGGGTGGYLTRAHLHHLTITSDAGACVGSTNGTIQDSEVDECSFTITSYTCSAWNTLCFEWFNTTALNNEIHHNLFNGVLSLTGTNPVLGEGYRYWIHNNYWNITNHGQEYAIEPVLNSCIFDHNFISGGLYPFFCVDASAVEGHLIHHNVFDWHYDCGAINVGPTRVFSGGFYNNTIVMRHDATGWPDLIVRSNASSELWLKNNIIHSVDAIGDKLGSPDASECDYNAFYNVTARGTNTVTDIVDLPLTGGFPDAYVLPGDSPAKNAGTEIAGITSEETPDLGAFEGGTFAVGLS